MSKARSRWALPAWLGTDLRGKLQLQTACVVCRHSNVGLRRCSQSLVHCLAAPAVPLLLSHQASRRLSSMCFIFWLRLETAWRFHFGSLTKPGLLAVAGVPTAILSTLPSEAGGEGDADQRRALQSFTACSQVRKRWEFGHTSQARLKLPRRGPASGGSGEALRESFVKFLSACCRA